MFGVKMLNVKLKVCILLILNLILFYVDECDGLDICYNYGVCLGIFWKCICDVGY